VARSIPGLQQEIEDECRAWNREDGIIALLCLDDAYDNLLNVMMYGLTIAQDSAKVPDEYKAAWIQHVVDRFMLMRMAMDLIANLGKDGPGTMSTVPKLEVSVGPNDDELLIDHLISQGKLRMQDAYVPGQARLMGRFFMNWVVRVIDGKDTLEHVVVERVVRLIGKINRVLTYASAVHAGRSLRTVPNLSFPLVNFPRSITPRQLMASHDLGPRKLWDSSSSPAEWMSDYGPAMKETLESIHFGIDSPIARKGMKRETDELFKGFQSMAGFSELFFSLYGFSMDDFRKVTDALQEMALARPHLLYRDVYRRIVRNATKISGVRGESVTKIVRSLSWQSGTLTAHFPIIKLNFLFAFTLITIRRAVHSRLDATFHEYDNNLKGEAFENSCRVLCSTQGVAVYPGRLVVKDQVLSHYDSLRIWGRKKVGTDFDVLATKGKYLLVVECKERKVTTTRKTRLENMMDRYMEELFPKSVWLANNLKILNGAPEFGKIVGQNASFVMPLIVCNFVVDEFGPPRPLLTFRELAYFLQEFDFSHAPTNHLFLDIPVAKGRTIRANIFRPSKAQ